MDDENTIKDYQEKGFNTFLQRGRTQSKVIPEDQARILLPEISGSTVAAGSTRSKNGKLYINWDMGELIIDNGGGGKIAFDTGGHLKISRAGSATLAFEFDPETGSIKKNGYEINTPQQLIIPLASGGASGGGSSSFYTDNDLYQKIHPSRITLDPDNYPGASMYLQAVYKAGASGDPARTFYMNLKNITTEADVTDSEISGTGQAVANVLPILTGTTDLRSNLATGNNDYVVQIRSSDAGLFVDLYEARLIVQW